MNFFTTDLSEYFLVYEEKKLGNLFFCNVSVFENVHAIIILMQSKIFINI